MRIIRPIIFAVCLLLAIEAQAQEVSQPPSDMPDMLYKGFVGKALDALPMDSEKRVILQRTNAILSGPLTGRSLSVWAGITNPVLLIVGVVWGIYAALNIKAPETKAPEIKATLHTNSGECVGEPPVHSALVAIRPPIYVNAELTQ